MPIYILASKEILEHIKQYTKKGEVVRISTPLEYNNILYREIVFSKKLFGNFRKENLGYLYINEKNEIATEKFLQERLAKLAYFSEIFYNTENRACIVNSFQDESTVEKDKKEYKLVAKGLELLTKEGVVDSEQVKQIVTQLPDIRKKNNETLKQLIDKSQEFKEEKKYFNEHMLEELLPTYRDALSINLQKIRLVYSASECYENIKRISENKRKQMSIRLNQKLAEPLKKIIHVMKYFIKTVNTCEKISEMQDTEYFKYLGTIEKANVDYRVKLNRRKKNS
ncbi:hypothetical protein K2F40_04480 [Clostridium sp. CM028]|uniref:hypothetical protein n=1 Tax=unclassified Clostridium TaxID=2614128 RepID=UPI001C6E1918|nr:MULTISPECIES: hypothetical protein [unclassified Clostridium]MBW9146110.1 hypothetical protein [Clostridium sp. CM027]MBW9148233.1 hypothetical protein [Clostridium sp. CM028]UVE41713.1 hypothetical protein KTC92_04350 [Clostridium sp. CM027]WLC62344.1 hypothetical protein KTC94_03430 [Clostridium sp. CM028]